VFLISCFRIKQFRLNTRIFTAFHGKRWGFLITQGGAIDRFEFISQETLRSYACSPDHKPEHTIMNYFSCAPRLTDDRRAFPGLLYRLAFSSLLSSVLPFESHIQSRSRPSFKNSSTVVILSSHTTLHDHCKWHSVVKYPTNQSHAFQS
jgi:hypothetical protein